MKSYGKLFRTGLVLCGLGFGLLANTICINSQGASLPNQPQPVRRALLVGLSRYNKLPGNRSFPDLPSVKNDLRAMENLLRSPNYRFDVKRLEDEDATGANILAAFEQYLIKEANPGDVSVFYFSGHGSQVRNSLGGENDKFDETFVPFDVVRPVKKKDDLKDIRDKEIKSLLLKAVAKGVKIVFIADSCHSGSIGRDNEEIRELEPAEFDVADPVNANDIDGSPANRGALIISAAQDFQRAKTINLTNMDLEDFKHGSMGNLTANLILTLYETPADVISAENLFNRTAARMRSNGLDQDPELDATGERRRKTLFGTELNPESPRSVVASEGPRVFLRAGLSSGLAKGSELVRVGATGDEETTPRVRIRLTNVGLAKSEFEVVSNTDGSLPPSPKTGDLFRQVTWGSPASPVLTIWLPESNFTGRDLEQIVAKFDSWKEKIDLTTEPTLRKPTHVLDFARTENKLGWRLTFPNSRPVLFNEFPSLDELQKAISGDPNNVKPVLFVDLPPPTELVGRLTFGDSKNPSPIARATTPAGANYKLSGRGRLVDGKPVIEFAWVLPAVFDSMTQRSSEKSAVSTTALPPITDWIGAFQPSAETELKKKAQKLATIRGWLSLRSAPLAEKKFPYRLEFRNSKGEKIDDGQTLIACTTAAECESYQMFLVRTPDRCSPKFFAYVMAIDQSGSSVMLFSSPGSNSPIGQNCIAGENSIPREIPLDGNVKVIGGEVTIGNVKYTGVVGIENFVLLLTDQPITNKELLQFDGVRKGNSRTGLSPLEFLLNDIGAETRSREGASTPDNWFVQQLTFRSRLK